MSIFNMCQQSLSETQQECSKRASCPCVISFRYQKVFMPVYIFLAGLCYEASDNRHQSLLPRVVVMNPRLCLSNVRMNEVWPGQTKCRLLEQPEGAPVQHVRGNGGAHRFNWVSYTTALQVLSQTSKALSSVIIFIILLADVRPSAAPSAAFSLTASSQISSIFSLSPAADDEVVTNGNKISVSSPSQRPNFTVMTSNKWRSIRRYWDCLLCARAESK